MGGPVQAALGVVGVLYSALGRLRNRLVLGCRGDVIVFYDCDDWYGPGYLPWAVARLRAAHFANPNATALGLLFHSHALINPDGGVRLMHALGEGAHAMLGYRRRLIDMCTYLFTLPDPSRNGIDSCPFGGGSRMEESKFRQHVREAIGETGMLRIAEWDGQLVKISWNGQTMRQASLVKWDFDRYGSMADGFDQQHQLLDFVRFLNVWNSRREEGDRAGASDALAVAEYDPTMAELPSRGNDPEGLSRSDTTRKLNPALPVWGVECAQWSESGKIIRPWYGSGAHTASSV